MYKKGNFIMEKKTRDLLHESYNSAVTKSTDILEIIENLYDSLSTISNSSISDSDMSKFETFLRGLYASKMIRRQTYQMSNLVIDLVITIMHISIWLNSTQNIHMLADINGRRKALETEFEKLWEKKNSIIHDRFGIRTVVSNSDSEEENIALLFEISNYVIDILTQQNRKLRDEFLSWLFSTEGLDSLDIQKIEFVLNLPFRVDLDLHKDYVSNPKPSTYQSLHWVISLESFSEILPGAELELQFRTHDMHENTTVGPASKYSQERRIDTKGVFCVEDFSKVKIKGFYSYDSEETDTPAIHFARKIIYRTVSPTQVYLS